MFEFDGKIYKTCHSLYTSFPFPKCQYRQFRERLKKGVPIIKAIRAKKPEQEVKRATLEKEVYDPYIRIGLSLEERKVFDKVYRDIILELENQEEEEIDLERLENIKKEYEVFLFYNK